MQLIPRTAAQLGGTLAVGAGAVVLAPIVMPVLAGILKPVTKAVIKGGLIAIDTVKVKTAQTYEAVEDLAAEAKAEVDEQLAPKSTKKKKPAKAA
jgi:hypothetical protein